MVWRQQLETQVSHVQVPEEGHLLNKLLESAPTSEMEAQWQVIQVNGSRWTCRRTITNAIASRRLGTLLALVGKLTLFVV